MYPHSEKELHYYIKVFFLIIPSFPLFSLSSSSAPTTLKISNPNSCFQQPPTSFLFLLLLRLSLSLSLQPPSYSRSSPPLSLCLVGNETRNLWLEVSEGETSLENSTPPIRTVEFVIVRIIGKDGRFLVESHQVLSNGTVRRRGQPLSEKMKLGETVEAAVDRAVKEEVGSILGGSDVGSSESDGIAKIRPPRHRLSPSLSPLRVSPSPDSSSTSPYLGNRDLN